MQSMTKWSTIVNHWQLQSANTHPTVHTGPIA